MKPNRWLQRVAAYTILILVLVMAVGPVSGAPGEDAQITGQTYVRHDGGSDIAIEHCNNTATDEAGDNDPTDIDVDSNDGGSRRQGNEPFTVVSPIDPNVIVAGWNDYCTTDLGSGWQGFAYSLDGGQTWTNSLVPGYRWDTSEEGMASPLYGTHSDAGDPVAAFDNAGNLFVGGISFNRVRPSNGDIFVAKYAAGAHPSGFPFDYEFTRIVGKGTPSSPIGGIFQDKVMLEVDRTGGVNDGNVYVCWTRFTGAGQNKVFFTRSTDGGNTFSRPISLSRSNRVMSVQGCDIAVEHDGDVYVTYRTYTQNRRFQSGLAFARSTNGGRTFSTSKLIRNITVYFPFDSGQRDCGDGPFLCPSDYVFHRVPLEPRVTADQSGQLPGVYLIYNAVRPDSIVPAETSYVSSGAGTVGQSLVYMVSSMDNGSTWSSPLALDPVETGHQYFPDIDAFNGRLAAVWQDNRTDPAYSVQRPVGNIYDSEGRAVSVVKELGTSDITNTYFAYSTDGTSFSPSVKVSVVGHQPQYEMFGSRDIPFQGDYNWISLAADGQGGTLAYMSWTDNRNVVMGADPRELQAYDGFDDGFDVKQCRIDLGAPAPTLDPNIPLARRDAPFSGDTCGNAGGLDQDIFGASYVIP